MRFILAASILAFLVSGSGVRAQSPNASIAGIVFDPDTKSIAGAEVIAVNDATGLKYVTLTNGDGIYTLENLPPGPYRLQISKVGFKGIIKPDIILNVQDALSLNFTLPIGASSVTVTVEGGASLINTQSAAVSTVVDRNFVANTPLNGRSFQDLISMTPGVVTQSPNQSPGGAGSGGDFSVNGQRSESNYYMVDGVSGNVAAGTGSGTFLGQPAAGGSVAGGTVLGTTQSLVSVDALQEFRVQSSTYSAEYGRAPGGQFSLVTRSGANEFHGDAFEYLRNNFFDANDWFNEAFGVPESALRQNDFGGTLGGPILVPGVYDGKDKTFFFVSYEGLRLTQPQAASSDELVPDTYLREQAPAALQPILNAFPVQSPGGIDYGTAAAPSLAQFIGAYSLPSAIDSTSVRLDHTFGAKLSIFFRFADTPSSQSTRGNEGSLSVLSQSRINTQTYTWGAVSQLSSTKNNDLRIGYARSESTQQGRPDSFGGATPTDLPVAFGAASSPGPSLALEIYAPGVGFSRLMDNARSANRLRQFNLIDTFDIMLGHHQLKAGVDYRRITAPGREGSPSIYGVFEGAQGVLSDQALVLAVANQLPATPIFNEAAAFFQDEWHAMPGLTVSLGLRWEANPPPHGSHGQDAYTVLGSLNDPSSLTLAPRGTPLVPRRDGKP